MQEIELTPIQRVKQVLSPRIEELKKELAETRKEIQELKEKHDLRLAIKDYSLEEIKQAVADVLEIDVIKLSEVINTRPYPDARKLYSLFVSNNTETTREVIGASINRNHSTITSQVKEGMNLYSYDKVFVKNYDKIESYFMSM